MYINKAKGFTLIELLVVIAIIGILSGLIIVAMGGATNSAKDARIKSGMDQLRTAAAIYYNNHSNSYGSLTTNGSCAGTNFASTGDGATLIADMATQETTAATCWGDTASLGTFCVLKKLNTGSGVTNFWCIDSNGYSGNPTTTNGCTLAAHNLCNN